MQLDLSAAELPAEGLRAPRLKAEVCIIGAGLIGILLAHKLALAGKEVILLEAGGLRPEAAALQAFSDPAIHWASGEQQHTGRVEMSGYLHPGSAAPPAEAFGGNSLTWGGQLLPLPESATAELAPRWPVAPALLASFHAEAEQILGVDGLPYDGPDFFAEARTPVPSLFAAIPETTLRVSKFAPFSHRSLAQTLGRGLLQHPRVRVVFHARATELVLAPNGSAVHAVLVQPNAGRTSSGKPVRVEAKEFIVAAGTVQTVRLLLASQSVRSLGVGNQHDQVGRNVHDHLTLSAAVFAGPAREAVLEQLRPWMARGLQGTTAHSLKLEASAALRRRLDLNHVMAHVTVDEPTDSPLGTLRAVLRGRQGRGAVAALRTHAGQLPPALAEAARLAWSARVNKRRYVSPHATVSLRLNSAQRTPSASRITLSHTVDPLGERRPVLTWMIAPAECEGLMRFAAHVRSFLCSGPKFDRSVAWAPALFPPPGTPPYLLIPELTDARHLMGGARMGSDPRNSVVDPDLQVHDVENLHVASLAAFPDGTAQLPTLTLMALALRLAERLTARLT